MAVPADTAPDLVGWDVLAVGRRQAWLFVTLGAPTPGRDELTLWIDNPWRVEPGKDGEPTLADLDRLVLLFVESVSTGPEELSIRFDDGTQLTVDTEPAQRDSDGWWFGPVSK